MMVFRLSRRSWHRDMSGTGARLSGGRWNSKGVAMLYTSESRALCVTEISVRIPLGVLPKDYMMVTLEVPDTNIQVVKPGDLRPGWDEFPHQASTQTIGDAFIRHYEALILKVPSVVVSGDSNYLINPAHHDMQFVRIVDAAPFEFDSRLFKR